MTSNEPGYETIATDELARLRRIEAAAKDVLTQMEGTRSATTILTALAALRAALRPSDAP
ncbi:MAG TPA: hypothetical protein VLE71_01705 [Actinomycetota bacterium]|nr:hypothetical protein [Actinomycetota bacterium]